MTTFNVHNFEDEAFSKRIVSLLDNWYWRLNNLYHIEDERGDIVPFRPRKQQKQFLLELWWKNIILKSRQHGFTTLIDVLYLDRCLFNSNLRVGIIAHRLASARDIFQAKIKVPYDALPHWIKTCIVPTGDTKELMTFNNGSQIQVNTSLRSGTLQAGHISEYGKTCARYPEKAKEIKTGTLPTLHEGSITIIESTAEGVGGDFYDKSIRALVNQRLNKALTRLSYKFHFYPWFVDAKNRVVMSDDEGLSLTQDQEDYFSTIEAEMGLDELEPEQIQWYLLTEEDLGNKMKQEHPSTPQEAFLFSGRAVFDMRHVTKAEQYVESPLLTGIIDDEGKITTSSGGVLKVFKEPSKTGEYYMGVDTSEGLRPIEDEDGTDNSAIHICNSRGFTVCTWASGHLEPSDFANIVHLLAVRYNKAFIVPESNSVGAVVIDRLRHTHKYSNIYADRNELIQGKRPTNAIYGWRTTRPSKNKAVDALKTQLKNAPDTLLDSDLIEEMKTYTLEDNGAMNAMVGCRDDRVIAAALAITGMEGVQAKARGMTAADESFLLNRPVKKWMNG